MSPGEYYLREKARRLASARRRLFGPGGEDLGEIRIPMRTALAAMPSPTVADALKAREDLERRRRRARALGVPV
jgi:hypothetical protein